MSKWASRVDCASCLQLSRVVQSLWLNEASESSGDREAGWASGTNWASKISQRDYASFASRASLVTGKIEANRASRFWGK